MSPTSLRNHRSQRRTPLVRPVPPHRRALAFLRTISKRARFLITATTILIIYKLATRAPSLLPSPHPTSPTSASPPPHTAPSVLLAPSQPRPPSAKLRFTNGRTQEVFPNGAVAVMGEQAGYERVWNGHEVGKVELPVGGRLSVVYEGGGLGSVEKDEEGCGQKGCRGIRQVRLELDLLRGLREVKRAGKLVATVTSGVWRVRWGRHRTGQGADKNIALFPQHWPSASR